VNDFVTGSTVRRHGVGAALIFRRDIEKILAQQVARHAFCKIANKLGSLMAVVSREM